MNLLNIDVQDNIQDIINAFTEVYGKKYRDVIETRMSKIYYIMYNDVDGISGYINSLKNCKQKELGIKFLQQIGIDVSKYEGISFVEDLDKDTNTLLQEYMDGYKWGINPEFKHDPIGIKAWNPPEEGEEPNQKKIEENRIKFINFLRGQNAAPITKETYQAFCETDEYKNILGRIEGYLQIHNQLLEEYASYMQEIAPYQQYVDYETKRKDDLHEQQRLILYEQVSIDMPPLTRNYLPDSLKKFLDSKGTSIEEKCKLFIGDDIGMKLYVEWFSQEDEDKLNDPSVSQEDKDNIYSYRSRYFTQMGITDKHFWNFGSKKDWYNHFLQQDGVAEVIPTTELVRKITQLRIERYEKCQEKFIYGSQDFSRIMSKGMPDTPSNRQAIYERKKNKLVSITAGFNNKGFFSILFYTVKSTDCGNLDYTFLHEICHCIEAEYSPEIGFRSGFELIKSDVSASNPYNIKKRKYERSNENIADILAIETRQILHNQGIYIFEPREIVRTDISDTDTIIWNTSCITRDMLATFMTRYREPIIEARLFGDMKAFYDIVGTENFEELNDVINRVDYMCTNEGLGRKLKNNQSEDPLVVEYNQQLARLEQIYADMEAHQTRDASEDVLKSAVSATEEITRTGQINDGVSNLTHTIQKGAEQTQEDLKDARY
ncbi:MAG: hypothetical protein FWF46_02270 [Oscillospiraceae bacterium]|nr:hypothetical protein [Oscillospiraceae bacterium]